MANIYDNPGPTFENAPKLSPAFREEPFQPRGKRMPVSLATVARPQTFQRPMQTLDPQRMSVTVRRSNMRPNEAGEGESAWFVSNPTPDFLGEDPATPAANAAAIAKELPKPSTIVMVGIAAAVLYFMAFKR